MEGSIIGNRPNNGHLKQSLTSHSSSISMVTTTLYTTTKISITLPLKLIRLRLSIYDPIAQAGKPLWKAHANYDLTRIHVQRWHCYCISGCCNRHLLLARMILRNWTWRCGFRHSCLFTSQRVLNVAFKWKMYQPGREWKEFKDSTSDHNQKGLTSQSTMKSSIAQKENACRTMHKRQTYTTSERYKFKALACTTISLAVTRFNSSSCWRWKQFCKIAMQHGAA